MPLYDFECRHCQHRLEEFRRMADATSERDCPVCNGSMRRVYSHVVQGDGYFDTVTTPDGIRLDTRRKYEAYMKERGYTVASDYKNTWAQAEKDRAKLYDPRHHGSDKRMKRERIEALSAAWERLHHK